MNTHTSRMIFPEDVISRHARPARPARPLAIDPGIEVDLVFSPFDLAPVLRLAAWLAAPQAASQGIELCVDVPGAGLRALCDEISIQKVVESLLSNAIKFSPCNTAVTLTARREGGMVRVWVEDSGPGVHLAQQPALFDERGRAAHPMLDGPICLCDCRRIVRAHNGIITMHNHSPHGAHFEFCLPALSHEQATGGDFMHTEGQKAQSVA